jgi:hypothetical protein
MGSTRIRICYNLLRMEKTNLLPPHKEVGARPKNPEALKKQRKITILSIAISLILVGLISGSIYYLLQPQVDTAKLRDSFIILLAVEISLVGFTLVLLLFQVAKLINLVQNEIKPLLASANETISTVRGTAAFISDAFVEPVVKLNGMFASLRKVLDLFNLKI